MTTRRTLLGLLAAAAATPRSALAWSARAQDPAAAAAEAAAQAWPNARPIRLVAPVAPGSSQDIVARLTARHLGEALGQNVLVENRPGASGTMGAQFLVGQARPDGYSLSQMHLSIIRRIFL